MTKKRRKRRAFTDEYRAEVVQLVETSGKSIGQIAHDLELTESEQPDLEAENRELRKLPDDVGRS